MNLLSPAALSLAFVVFTCHLPSTIGFDKPMPSGKLYCPTLAVVPAGVDKSKYRREESRAGDMYYSDGAENEEETYEPGTDEKQEEDIEGGEVRLDNLVMFGRSASKAEDEEENVDARSSDLTGSYTILHFSENQKPRNPYLTAVTARPVNSRSKKCGDLAFCQNTSECKELGLVCCPIPGSSASVCMKPLEWAASS